MISFLQISLTSNCNLSCWHCPMAKYRNSMSPDYALTNARLVPWIEKYIPSSDWIIELTGGEPALYQGIDELCEWLSSNHYRTLVKTNGMLKITPRPSVIRVAAFHQLENPPKFFDRILIVDKIQRVEKEDYCRKMGYSYQIIGFNDEVIDSTRHEFTWTAYIDPHGHPVACKNRKIKFTDWPDRYAIEYMGLKKTLCCADCKAAIDAWRFLPDSWKTK